MYRGPERRGFPFPKKRTRRVSRETTRLFLSSAEEGLFFPNTREGFLVPQRGGPFSFPTRERVFFSSSEEALFFPKTREGFLVVFGPWAGFPRGPAEGCERGGRSSVSGCISYLCDSDGGDFNLTWPRGTLLPPFITNIPKGRPPTTLLPSTPRPRSPARRSDWGRLGGSCARWWQCESGKGEARARSSWARKSDFFQEP